MIALASMQVVAMLCLTSSLMQLGTIPGLDCCNKMMPDTNIIVVLAGSKVSDESFLRSVKRTAGGNQALMHLQHALCMNRMDIVNLR